MREGSSWAFYRQFVTAPQLTSAYSGSEPAGGEVRRANRADAVIGFGSIAVSRLSDKAQKVWVELNMGGGRVNLEVQMNMFVDPQFQKA